ncbi:MAG: DUF1127 domain-containing protein [Tabrizicola sp.]|nr:DUF1127 domain-containing protein [Tabrizicola sp.]
MTNTATTDRDGGLALRLWRWLPFRRTTVPGIDALSDRMLADIGVTRDTEVPQRLPPELEALRYSS